MAGESQQQPESLPDPTVLTTDAITRAVRAERDYFESRFDTVMAHIERMDKATTVLSETVNRTPTDIQREIKHLREYADSQVSGLAAVVQQRKESVDKHFDHLDKVRGEDKREAREMVNLALSTEKDARAVALTTANTAIEKAAIATDKRYDALDKAQAEMRMGLSGMMPRKESEARHSAHEQAVTALLTRITAIEAMKAGGQEVRTDTRSGTSMIIASISVATAIIVMVLIVASFFIGKPN